MTDEGFSGMSSEIKPRKKLFYYPELTPCARFIMGNASLFSFAMFAVLMSLVPWVWLYHQPWYRAWIDVVAHWSPSIRKLPHSPSQIVELASAYLAFSNTLGPFYVLVSLRCAFRHLRNPEVYERNRHIGTGTLLKFLLMVTLYAPLPFWGALAYEGAPRPLYPTDLFYTSGPAFIGLNAVAWWLSGGVVVIPPFLVRLLHERWKRKRSQGR